MKYTLSIILIFTLLGCATSYQKDGFSGGFSTTQLNENIFTVTFKGNEYTARDKANDFALLRSAEVALENGFSYFTIVDAKEYAQTGSYTSPITTTTNVNESSYGSVNKKGKKKVYNDNSSAVTTTTTTGGQTHHYVKPRTANTIACFKDKPEGFSYNAKFLSKSLRAKHELDPTPYN